MKKEKLSKRIYNYFGLDKRLNRFFFVFGVFFGYWLIFYTVPILLMSAIYGDKTNFLNTFSYLLFNKEIINDDKIWLYVIQFIAQWPQFYTIQTIKSSLVYNEWGMLYYYFIAPLFILIPCFTVIKILPKYNKLKVILWGGSTVIFSIIYIYIYTFWYFSSNRLKMKKEN